MNASVFRAVFESSPPPLRRRYKLRWDWHLRNLLYACIPPSVLFVLLKLAEWKFEREGKKLITLEGSKEAEEKSIAERMDELERALEEIRGKDKTAVEMAKIVAKGLSRQLNGDERQTKGKEAAMEPATAEGARHG